MCGIVGYLGEKAVLSVMIGGLERLAYRGYDSAGVATIVNGEFEVFRSEGKLSNLKRLLEETKKLPGTSGKMQIGIGHTRWATHGRPSETNAHPHVAGRICLVHNGIIENYADLREDLLRQGRRFLSETDTEIAGHLIDAHLQRAPSLREAVRRACAEFRGAYALVVMSLDDPNSIVVAKNSTPVIVGLGDRENFVASDIPAILDHTRRVLILEDGEIAEVRRDSVLIEREGAPVTRDPMTVTWDAITAEKGGYRHFMLKEIHEQPAVVTQTFRGRIDQVEGEVLLADLKLTTEELRSLERVVIVACGTAWHASLMTKFFIEECAHLSVEVDYGSEFRYRAPLVDRRTLFVVMSQSGETIDTLGSLNLATELGARTVAICNVVGSSIARRAQDVLYTFAGPEMSVASTKAFVTQLVAGYLLALRLGAARGVLSPGDLRDRFEDLVKLPQALTAALGTEHAVEKIARHYGRSDDFLFLGRGVLYPIALEGALKLKEISYVHAEGYPAGEMKHGPIALVNEEMPVVVVLGSEGVNYEKTISNMTEVSARGGQIIAVTDVPTSSIQSIAQEVIAVGEVPPSILPLVLTVPLQLLAYHVAVYRGTDVDQPRNLAKSVVVE